MLTQPSLPLRTTAFLLAFILAAAPALAANPDGRPSVTVTLHKGGGTGNQFEREAGGSSASTNDGTNYNGWTSSSFVPQVDLRVPTQENITMLIGGSYRSWSQDIREPLVVTSGGIDHTFTLKNKESLFDAYVGVRFYFGHQK